MTPYEILLIVHSWNRWAVAVALLALLPAAWQGIKAMQGAAALRDVQGAAALRPRDIRLRKFYVSALHLQVAVGLALYFVSPLAEIVRADPSLMSDGGEFLMFGLLHPLAMLALAVWVTLHRATTPAGIFRIVVVSLVAIGLFVPWPWSPFAQRILLRP